jgi:DNA-binding NarL/FixJ family response regulator
MLSTLIVGNNSPLMQYVRQVTGEFDDICVYKIIDDSMSSYEFARNLATYAPDVIFLELTADSFGQCSRLVADIYGHSPNTAIVGVAALDSDEIRQAASSTGVKIVLTLPFSAEQLQQALLDSMLPKVSAGAGRLGIMLSARPGSGATVVGWNIAHVLATVFNNAFCSSIRIIRAAS